MNKKDLKLAFVGGDRRFSTAAAELRRRGFRVSAFALDCPGFDITCLDDCIDGAAAVILPLPVSGDGIHVTAPLCPTPPKISDIFDRSVGKTILGGRFSPAISSDAEKRGLKTIDYYDDEDFKQKNALPTAEGAIYTAMRALDITLYGAKTAITGYGRIGRALAPRLAALGASVTVAARSSDQLNSAALSGFDTLKITRDGESSSLSALTKGFDAIFNTVPAWLFDSELVGLMSGSTLFIDLASAPGGIDPAAAAAKGLRIIKAPSLPGIYSPVTAGEIISDTVILLLEKTEI